LKLDHCDRLKHACSPATSDEAVWAATSPYHNDALADALAEARVDVWARLVLALKHWQRQLNNFRLSEDRSKTAAIRAFEPK
jgi:hypothetical protein